MVSAFLAEHGWTILFYSIIIILLFLFRKKFDRHGIMFLYRTKIGLKAMDRYAAKYKNWIKVLSYISIGVGLLGIIVISVTLIQNLIKLIMNPAAQSGIALILPGVKVPGSPIQLPLVFGWIALFVAVLIHEFCHGLVSRAHDLPVKSSGIVFLGPLAGAFVEPDEKKLLKQPDDVQYAVYSAGPFSNIITAFIFLGIGMFIFTPAINAMTTPSGFTVEQVQDGMPAYAAGIQNGDLIDGINSQDISSFTEFSDALTCIKPNDTVSVRANGTWYTLVMASNPDNPGKAYMGIKGLRNQRDLKSQAPFFKMGYGVLSWFTDLFEWLILISFGLGLANLLPLGPIDGGRMLQVSCIRLYGRDKGLKVWARVGIIGLTLLLLNLLFPLFRWAVSAIVM